ncbi:MAG: RrF2 family transcriptional regulator [Clostridia bacterium]|nr:RrF2 family transcriptional regulator [Clostridia bacterium]MBR4442603.1 RrF2 family transcriptional regulator [Clostridia bacterium]
MMVSTRGHYALLVMIDLAEQQTSRFIPLKDIAARQGISEKYLESIVKLLVQAGFLEGLRGKGGGYRLLKAPENCNVGQILRLTEETLAPVSCLDERAQPCQRAATCKTLPMWQKLHAMINGYFDGITIADLMDAGQGADNYVI